MTEPSQSASFLFEQKRQEIQRSFPVMVKPAGSLCNLDCDYCYYLEKSALYPDKQVLLSSFKMPEILSEKLIREYIQTQSGQQAEFIWHGGEPALPGMDYFRKITGWQKKYANGKKIINAFQTNGTLINDEWAEFLATNHFFCGLSIDGPRKLHDKHRRFPNGQGSWEKAANCASLFRKHGVEFNILSVVNATNSKQPAAVYEFLKSLGTPFIQFTPIAERITLEVSEELSIVSNDYSGETAFMRENVNAEDWGNFLCRVFDLWIKQDVGRYFINYFDNTLAAYAGQAPALCTMAPCCACTPAIEHNGDVYCCDHFVFPEYKLGNITSGSLRDMVKSDPQLFFEQRKQDTLSQTCRSCEFLFTCGGDCPKNRFTPNGEDFPISCLCEGFRHFFRHSRKHFEFMANELKHHRAPANIMNTKI